MMIKGDISKISGGGQEEIKRCDKEIGKKQRLSRKKREKIL